MTGRFKQALLEKGKMPKKFSVKSGDKSKAGGLTAKGVKRYRAANPGSKLKTAVTTKPSKLKKGSKSAKRRKSFCARMGGMKKRLTSAKTRRDPDSRINKALRKWNCSTDANPNALSRMAECIHNTVSYQLFIEERDERVLDLIECAVVDSSEITQELLDDAYLMESVLTPIVIEELNNPLNESSEDLHENIFRRMGAGLANAGAKVATGLGRAGYQAASTVGRGLGRAAYGGAKEFYKGLTGDQPIGRRLGARLRGGLAGARDAIRMGIDAAAPSIKRGIDKAGYSLGKKIGQRRAAKQRAAAAARNFDPARLSQQGRDVRDQPIEEPMSKEDAMKAFERRASKGKSGFKAPKFRPVPGARARRPARIPLGDDDRFGAGINEK